MSKSKNYIRNLCLASVMAALYVGLDYFSTSLSGLFGGSLKLSFSGLPVIIMSVFGGTVWGMLTGFVGAFIGQMITYGFTVTTLLWVLPAVVRGLSMGLLFIAFKRSIKSRFLVIETIISSVLVTAVNTGVMIIDFLILNYTGEYNYYGTLGAVFLGVPMRLISGIITAVIFAIILPYIIKLLNKIIKN